VIDTACDDYTDSNVDGPESHSENLLAGSRQINDEAIMTMQTFMQKRSGGRRDSNQHFVISQQSPSEDYSTQIE